MSKLYEALQQPGVTPAPAVPVGTRASTRRPNLAGRRDMEALYQSLEAALPGGTGKLVLFTASRAREGTTTIVREFAATIANVLGASVLVVDADPHSGAASLGASPVRLPDLMGGLFANGTQPKQPGVTVATWDIGSMNLPGAGDGGAVLAQADALRAHFDYTVFDVPAIGDYPAAASLGRYVDGVVIVVEAERTRWPVVENTRRTYETLGAKVLGVVLNKRRFYIPGRIYRWL